MINEELAYKRAHFLEPEERCGVNIDSTKKATWKCMLDMLEVVIDILERHNLRYVLEAGSLLGAIRHKGFIPWDDDIDINVPRADYEKLQEILPKELPEYYFMQTTLTDPAFCSEFMKIRDVRTCAEDFGYIKNRVKINLGIFIDIFPFDAVPKSAFSIWWRKCINRRLYSMRFSWSIRKPWLKRMWFNRFLFVILLKIFGNERMYRFREWLMSSIDLSKCDEISVCPAHFGFVKKQIHRRSWYRQIIKVPFEYLMANVPAAYDDVLTNKFGDWHRFVRGGSLHGETIHHPDIGYKEFLRLKYGWEY